MEAYQLCIQAYGECSVLACRLNCNIGIMYDDRAEYYKAYDWFVESAETREKVCSRHIKGVLKFKAENACIFQYLAPQCLGRRGQISNFRVDIITDLNTRCVKRQTGQHYNTWLFVCVDGEIKSAGCGCVAA